MRKLVITENSSDPALLAAGRALVSAQTGQSTQRIEVSTIPAKYNVQFLSSQIKQDGDMQKEIARIKVTPTRLMQNFRSDISTDFSTGIRTNHFFKLPEMVDLASTQTESYSTSKSQASYSFETVFNYISEEYDRLQVGISELNLPSPFDMPSMEDFLNLLDSNTSIIKFGRGSRMKNFVVAQGVQQGSDNNPYYNHLR